MHNELLGLFFYMYAKKIKGYQKYYIHKDGYVFKSYGTKEIIIPIKVTQTVPKVQIGNQKYNLVFLMLEYFGDKIILPNEITQYRFKYKIVDNKIPLDSIKLVQYNSNKHTDLRMFNFKCLEKANSANSRVSNISLISEHDVFDSLLRTNFKCTYCNKKLNSKTWELDHISPLSKTGLNTPTNITPSCKKCNRMKSNLEITDFLNTCYNIYMNFKDSDLLYINQENLN